jgi:hypothetical protein
MSLGKTRRPRRTTTPGLRGAALASVAALAGCGGGSASPAPIATPSQPPAVSGHLYVAAGANVLRYPIVRGIPAGTPDFTYQSLVSPMCIDPSGNLYALSSANPLKVLVFARGSASPNRSLTLHPPLSSTSTGMAIDSLAVDANGFLYAGVMYGSSYLTFEDVWTFAPGASGNASPAATVNLLQYPSYDIPLYGLVAGGGQLYVSVGPIFEGTNTTGYVQHITSPESRPALSEHLISGGHMTMPGGLALDSAGNLYVVNLPSPVMPSEGTQELLVYAVPSGAFLRSTTPKSGTVSGTPAASNGIVFVPGTGGVYELRGDRNGPQQPIATLSITGASAVALGP